MALIRNRSARAWGYVVRSIPWSFPFYALYFTCSFVWAFPPNAGLLMTLLCVGQLSGHWIRKFRRWPCFVLVTSLPNRVFGVTLATLMATIVGYATISVLLGDALPAVGAAMLVGIVSTYCATRRIVWRIVSSFALVPAIIFLGATGLQRGAEHSLVEALSHPALQILSLAIAIAVAAMLKRRLLTPAFRDNSRAWGITLGASPVVRMAFTVPSSRNYSLTYVPTALAMLKHSLWIAAAASALDIILAWPLSGNNKATFASLAILVWPWAMINEGIDFRAAWLAGLGRTREQLARRIVGRIVFAGAVPMLAFCLAAVSLPSWLSDNRPPLEVLLIAQLIALVCFSINLSMRRKFPSPVPTSVVLIIIVPAFVIWISVNLIWPIDFRLSVAGFTTLIALLAVSAYAAVHAVGRGLARADHVH